MKFWSSTRPPQSPSPDARDQSGSVQVDGKFFRVGTERLWVKGVTYGTFAPDAHGHQFPTPLRVRSDFEAMAAAGINTVRLYTPPNSAVHEAAAATGLRLIVGLPWAQHLAFLDDRRLRREIRKEIREHARRLRSASECLLIALGNEIPAPVVRWHGAERIEAFLRELLDVARQDAPDRLYAYVNFPPTEFLDLSAFDVCAFNVYLHRPSDLRAYLARLQNIAGNKPLLLAEAGADSLREGESGQAKLTAMHIRAAFSQGCAGAVAFAWTDEWWRGGQDVEDWRFGLVDRGRVPKPALASVRTAFSAAPFPASAQPQPLVSVVVCAYNAARTLGECLQSLQAVRYPDVEILVINDGSRDETGAIARTFPEVRVIDIPNGGLSAARNVGFEAASGDIVAYVDSDARVDPDWLTYLVQPLAEEGIVAVGGPNVVPPDDPWLAQCVARAPGAPTHVLIDDCIAEHVPGCNMAFRREALQAVSGFNPSYTKAGDDVDICWRIQARGWRIAFAPAALVWHRHRDTIRAYWRQQVGYGEGEAGLSRDHPNKFVGADMLWQGRIYSSLPAIHSPALRRLQTGTWGTAAFPSVYYPHPARLTYVPRTVGFHLALALTALTGTLAFLFGHDPVGWLMMGLVAAGIALTSHQCLSLATETRLPASCTTRSSRLATWLMIAFLHWLQPWARFWGRLSGFVAPVERPREVHPAWRFPSQSGWRGACRLLGGSSVEIAFWSERWLDREGVLKRIVDRLRGLRLARRIVIDDGWQQAHDVAVPSGAVTAVRASLLIEEHPQGRTLLRVRLSMARWWMSLAALGALIAPGIAATALAGHPPAALAILAVCCALAVVRLARTAVLTDAMMRVVADVIEGLGAARLTASSRSAARPRPLVAARAVSVLLGSSLPSLLFLATLFLLRGAMMSVQLPHVGPPVERPAPWREPRVGLAVAPNGDLYLADARTDSIRRMSARGGTVSVVALAFQQAGPRPAAGAPVPGDRFDAPSGVAVSSRGELLVADTVGHRVYRVDRTTGATSLVAGTGEPGFGGDGGPAIDARLHTPTAVAFDRLDRIWIADAGNHRIRRVDPTGRIDTVAGGESDATSPGAPSERITAGRLAWPSDLALAPNGDLFVADTENHRVCRIDARTGRMELVAGSGVAASTGDGGPARQAGLLAPTGLALVARHGAITLYVAEANGRIRVVSPDGMISSLHVSTDGPSNQAPRLAYHPRGWLYVTDDPDRLTAFSLTGARPRMVRLSATPRRPLPAM